MPGPYLSADEIRDLTGYRTRAAACRWLTRNGWPYAEPAGGGWPRVLREYHDSRLSGDVTRKPKQVSGPNWSRPA